MRRARIRGRGGRRRATQAVATTRARTGRAGVEFANGCPKGCILGAWIASGCRWRRRVRPEQGANGGGLGYYCIRPRPHTRSSPDPDPGPAPRPSRVFVCPPALQPSSPCRPCSSPHTRAHTSHSHWSPPTHVFHPPLPVTPFHAAVLPPLFCFSLLAIHSCPLGSRAVAARPRDALHFLPLRLIDNPAIHETSPGPSTSRPPPPPVKPLLSFTSRFPSLKTPRPLARLPPALPTNTTTTATTLSPAVSST